MIQSSRRCFLVLLVLGALALPLTSQAQGLVNVNTATSEQLQTLPSIGPARSNAIIEYRQANGPFASVEDIINVSGIGPGIMNNIRALVTVGNMSGGQQGSPPPQERAVPQETQRPVRQAPERQTEGSPSIDLSSDSRPAAPSRAARGEGAGAGATQGGDACQGRVNINTASAEELVTLPGVGQSRANAIIEYRQANGPFGNIEDLINVTGIGAASMNNIRALICAE